MDTYGLNTAIEEIKTSWNCSALADEFRDYLRTVVQAAEAYSEIKDAGSENIDGLKDALSELRDQVESAQSSLSDLDDKMGDIYSKLYDADVYMSELEAK